MRVLQQWDGKDLIQAPCDISNALHAMTLRSLLLADAENNDVASVGDAAPASAGSTRAAGRLAVGRPVDVMTTANALDALSLFGDNPLETRWARRRAAEFLIAAQNADGSFAMQPNGKWFGFAWADERREP
jgi:prenyltransferase beta subunit